ncbi:MAG: hypothetical protein ACPLQO_11440, partial [Desulfotomaculales bacterium]
IGRKIIRIDRERFLGYLVDVYEGNLPAGGLTPLQILKYMEDGIYEEAEEEVPGLWVPFTLAPFLGEEDVGRGVEQLNDWIERWSPPPAGEEPEAMACLPARRVTAGELAEIIGAATSVALELATDTRPVVEAVRLNPGIPLEELLRLLGDDWAGAIRHLFVLGYLVTEGEVYLFTAPEDNRGSWKAAGKGVAEEESSLFSGVDQGPEEKRKGRPKRTTWLFGYPEGGVRYVKGTGALGRHLEKNKIK